MRPSFRFGYWGPLASGAGLCLSFPDWSLFLLAWVALVPYLSFLLGVPSWRRALIGHLVFSGFYFAGILYWIPGVIPAYGGLPWSMAVILYLLMILTLSGLLLPFSLLTRWLAARSPKLALLCVPGFWLLTELIRNDYIAGGFPWASLGYSQQPLGLMIQIADIGGVYLVSALVVLVNAAVVWSTRGWGWKLPIAVAGVLLLTLFYGFYRLYVWTPQRGETLRVALVQPDIALTGDRQILAREFFERVPELYRRAVASGAQWVVLPEAPNAFVYQQDFYFTTFWNGLVSRAEVPLLFNGTAVEAEQRRYFNSAFLIGAEGELKYRYDKNRLVPFGEYLPFGPFLGLVEAMVQGVGSFSPGDPETPPGRLDGISFSVLICYEAIFPEIARKAVARGAQLLVNITNDSWYGRTAAPAQHFQMAAFRALENRRFLVRCANSGYSALIDPWGRWERRLGLFETDTLLVDVPAVEYRSIYSVIGDVPAISLIIISLLALVATAALRDGGSESRWSRIFGNS